MTGCVGSFVSTLLSSTPSIENPLNRGRVPPMEPPEPNTPPCCVVVPGAKTANSFTSPPSVFTGKSFTTFPLKVAPSSEDSVLTRSAPASTSTTADTSPSSSATFASAVPLDSTVTPFWTDFLNPVFSTVIVYVPTSKVGKTYVPALDAVVETETPVASFVTVTLASTTDAPLVSATSTRNPPSRRWPRATEICIIKRNTPSIPTKSRPAIEYHLLLWEILAALSQFICAPSLSSNQTSVSQRANARKISTKHRELRSIRTQRYRVRLQVVRQCENGLRCNYFYDLRAILDGQFSKIRYFWML